MHCKDNDRNGYVFSENGRFLTKYYVPIGILTVSGISIWGLINAVRTSANRGSSIFMFLLFGALGLWMIFARKKIMKRESLRYIFEEHTIQNYREDHNAVVDIQMPVYITKTLIPGCNSMPWTEHFYILSNQPLAYVESHEDNGIAVVLGLSKQGAVVVPINDATETALRQVTGNVKVPEFPRCAYIPARSTGDGSTGDGTLS